MKNLEKGIIRCREAHIVLSNVKCRMLLTRGVVIDDVVLIDGTEVDLAKIEVLSQLPILKMLKEVIIFLGFAGCYDLFKIL